MKKVMPVIRRRRNAQPSLESLECRDLLTQGFFPFANIQETIAAGSKSTESTIDVKASMFHTRPGKPVILDFTATATAAAGSSGAGAPRLRLSTLRGNGQGVLSILSGYSSPGNLVASMRPGSYHLKVTGGGGSSYTVDVALAGDLDGTYSVVSDDVATMRSLIRSHVDVRSNRHLMGLIQRNLGASTNIRPLTIAVGQGFQAATVGGAPGVTDVVTVQASPGANISATPTTGTPTSVVAGSGGSAQLDAAALGIQVPTVTQFVATDSFGQRVQTAATVATPSLVSISGSALPSGDNGSGATPLSDSSDVSALLFLTPSGDLNVLASQDGVALADRTYLSASQMGATYGASASEISAVSQYIQAAGLKLAYTYQQGGTVRVSGSPSAFALAFGVTPLAGGDNDTLLLPWTYNGSINIPASLQGVVTAMIPVSNSPNGSFDPDPSALAPDAPSVPVVPPTASSGAPTALDLENSQVYNFPTGISNPGDGQNVGIIEMGGVYNQQMQDDFATYFQQLGITNPPHITAYGTQTETSSFETQADVEIEGAVAPGANIGLYFGYGGLGDMLEAIQSAAFQGHLSVLSISYQFPETYVSPMIAQAFNQVFMEAAGMGITTYVCSGDSGSSGGQGNGLAAVNFPASDPFVTAVGGTQSPNADATDQVVWDKPNTQDGDIVAGSHVGASGGGVSTLFPVPYYQSTLQPTSANPGGGTGRGGPDVASLAGAPGIEVRAFGVNFGADGTSLGAPLWAGLTAIIDQQLEAQSNGMPLGFFNSILYQQLEGQGLFQGDEQGVIPITSGDNITSYSAAPGAKLGVPTNIGYEATTGWSMTTGWGIPDGEVLLGDLEDLLQKPI